LSTLIEKQLAMRSRRGKHRGPVAKPLAPAVRSHAQFVLGAYLKWAEGWSAFRLAQHFGVKIGTVESLIESGFQLLE
jgi:hypothetical protein